MDDFKKTNTAGRGIATLFANAGWGIAAIGLLLAVTGLMLGHVPGGEAVTGPATFTGRLTAAGPGVAVALFGLFSVMVAAQTRAAMDTADMTRALLKLARAERKALPQRRIETQTQPAPVAPVAAPPAAEPAPKPQDDIPPMPVNLRPRIAAPVSTAAPRPEIEKPKAASRAEPLLKPASKVTPSVPKPHPIFSAKPPR